MKLSTTSEAQIATLLTLASGEFPFNNEASMTKTEVEVFRKRLKSCEDPLRLLSPDLLNRVYEEAAVKKTKLGNELINMLIDGHSSSTLRDYLVFQPLMPASTYLKTVIILRSLGSYKLLPKVDNYEDCDPFITQQAAGILTVTALLYSHRNELAGNRSTKAWIPIEHTPHGVFISSDALIHLILAMPEKAEQIADIIISRQTRDTNLILEILNNGSAALRSGVI